MRQLHSLQEALVGEGAGLEVGRDPLQQQDPIFAPRGSCHP